MYTAVAVHGLAAPEDENVAPAAGDRPDLLQSGVRGQAGTHCRPRILLAVDESSVILLHPPLLLAGDSTGMERGCQQNDRLVRS